MHRRTGRRVRGRATALLAATGAATLMAGGVVLGTAGAASATGGDGFSQEDDWTCERRSASGSSYTLEEDPDDTDWTLLYIKSFDGEKYYEVEYHEPRKNTPYPAATTEDGKATEIDHVVVCWEVDEEDDAEVPVPATPHAAAPDCTRDGSFTLPADTEELDWSLEGTDTTVGPGTFVVTAETNDGFEFENGETELSWEVEVLPRLTGADCEEEPEPTEDPEPTEEPEPNPGGEEDTPPTTPTGAEPTDGPQIVTTTRTTAPAAVPTVVDAGLTGSAATADRSATLGQGLMAGGFVLLALAGSLRIGRRRRGARQH